MSRRLHLREGRILAVVFAVALVVIPLESAGHGLAVRLFDLKFSDRGVTSYFETDFSSSDFPSAIITNVEFYGDCDTWNHSWSVNPVEYEETWYIYFSSGGHCSNVTLTMVLFQADALVPGLLASWKLRELKGRSMKSSRR